MDMVTQIKKENPSPWEDWEDHGGFDDDEALIGKYILNYPPSFKRRPWYYEKQQRKIRHSGRASIQLSFL